MAVLKFCPRIARLDDGGLLVNPGSVGCPGYDDTVPVPHVMESGTPDAMYAVVERRASMWRASLHAVPYEASAMVELARAGGRPEWAGALATGRVIR